MPFKFIPVRSYTVNSDLISNNKKLQKKEAQKKERYIFNILKKCKKGNYKAEDIDLYIVVKAEIGMKDLEEIGKIIK